MTYKGFSNTDFERAAQATLADHIRTVEDAALRNFQIGALLESNGRVSYSNAGRGFDWKVKYKLHRVEGNNGETQRNFKRVNLWKQAQLEYRGYQVTDSMYRKELLENRGQAGVIKVFEEMVDRLEQSIEQGLGTEYYVDGNATGNEQSWHGLESMMQFAATAETVNVSTGAARTANAADPSGWPDDTYAGLTTQLGDYGGANESGQVWPNGVADSQYDFWTPNVVNYTSSAFTGTTWAANALDAMRYGIIHAQRNSMSEQISNIILSRTLYREFLDLIDDKERIVINGENSLRALGFKNVVVFDGVEVSWESGVGGDTNGGFGYGFNPNCIDLRCMDDTMFHSEGPVYDEHSQAYNAVVSTLSNLKFKSPRNFVKYMSLA